MRNRMTKGKRPKRPKRLKRLGIAILALTVAAVLWFTVGPAAPVEEKQVVKIGMIAALTGPAAAPVQIGWRNTVDYLSDFETVGVPGVTLPTGVTIELVWGDHGVDARRVISHYDRMHNDVVFFYLTSGFEAPVLSSRLERDGIAAMVLCVDEAMIYPPGQIFTVFPTESESFAVMCDWIMENWQEERPPRVGIMAIDSPLGRALEVMGTAYAENLGIEILPIEIVPYIALDMSPYLLRLAERRADYVHIQSSWVTAVTILRDAERLGLTDEIRFSGFDNSQAIALLALGPVAEGYLSPRRCPWYEETPILFDVFREYQGRIDTEGDGAAMLVAVPVMIQAISIAIEHVGYENLDGRAVKEAMYSIKDFDPHDIGRPVTYTPEDHRGRPAVRIYEVQGGDVVPVSDWRDAPMLVPEA